MVGRSSSDGWFWLVGSSSFCFQLVALTLEALAFELARVVFKLLKLLLETLEFEALGLEGWLDRAEVNGNGDARECGRSCDEGADSNLELGGLGVGECRGFVIDTSAELGGLGFGFERDLLPQLRLNLLEASAIRGISLGPGRRGCFEFAALRLGLLVASPGFGLVLSPLRFGSGLSLGFFFGDKASLFNRV